MKVGLGDSKTVNSPLDTSDSTSELDSLRISVLTRAIPVQSGGGMPLVALEALSSETSLVVTPGVARGCHPYKIPSGTPVDDCRTENLRNTIQNKMDGQENESAL